ncbi:uncharacterized protein [Periplaneta americana]|uniref:uncharacterized protein n=1 Tax=Periplaneta americana TaxID=6978 RepID=UPI0037E7117C
MNILNSKKENGEKKIIHKKHLRKALSILKKRQSKSKQRDAALKKCTKDQTPKNTAVITPFSHTYVMLELRKCFLRHKWIHANKLMLMFINGGSRCLKPVMMKAGFLTLLHHPLSSPQLTKDFLSMCSAARNTDKLMKSLLTIPTTKKNE